MKVTRNPQPPVTFNPVTITLESEDELAVMISLIGRSTLSDYKHALGSGVGADRINAADRVYGQLYEQLAK